ncbi:MAG: hypothetical protein HUU37_08745 [Bdellovibrionales bacterium]|nr:hypothetical protein [Bdellovibrionales bacterium]
MIQAVSILILLILHFWRLEDVPGFHFDEAFAARLALRVATEAGYWPVEAQSPFTSAWSHWVAAAGFRVLGAGILEFRLLHMLEVWGGMIFLWAAVGKRWGKEARAWFFPAVALLPALYLNHRFAIELTGFHVFCFGVMVFGIAHRQVWMAVAAAVLGVWSHVLFLAPVLAVLGVIELEKIAISVREKRVVALGFASLLPFFYRIAVRLPDDPRPKAFVFLAIAGALFYAMNGGIPRWGGAPWVRRLLFAAAVAWWVPAFFFSEGHWMVLVAKGTFLQDAWVLPGLTIPAWGLAVGALRRKTPAVGREILFLTILTVSLGVMIPKPTPRYFELVFLTAAALGAVGLAGAAKARVAWLLGIAGTIWLFAAHYQGGIPVERDFRFAWFKDSSSDFLSKQEVASFLGSSGCGASDIRIADYRGGETFRFLSESGGWRKAGTPCAWPQAILRRSTEVSHGGKVVAETAGFVLEM